MPSVLGKRKSRNENADHPRSPSLSDSENSSESDGGNVQDAFRRAFEAKFKPLDSLGQSQKRGMDIIENGTGHDAEDSEWEGFGSEAEDSGAEEAVEIVEHNAGSKVERPSKAEARAFMNSKPPADTTKARPNKASGFEDGNEEDEETEKLNLKNDLALQRLINESHLLDTPEDGTLHSGQRQKRLDLRFQSLGSKSSILAQGKMPLAHRRGIVAKANEREEKRRREARENGVVLEKAARPRKKESEERRRRGVGGPSVGKFKGGMLKLSKRDVADIKGPRKKAMGKSRKTPVPKW